MRTWMSRKFSRRLACAFLFLIAAFSACMGLVLPRRLRAHLIQGLREGLLRQARVAALGLEGRPKEGLEAFSRSVAASCGCRVTLIAPDGRVLADSEVASKDLARVESHRERPEVRAAMERGEGTATRLSATVGEEFLYAAVPASAGVLRLALPLGQVAAEVGRQRRVVAAVSLLMSLVAVLLGLLLQRSLSRPLEEVSRAAARLAAGDYDARVRELPQDELGQLGATLNHLAERVRASVSELSAEKAQLSAVLANMVEGVVAVDADRRVLLVNDAFCRLLDMDAAAARGRLLVEVLRQADVGEFLGRALEAGAPQSGEARLFAPEERVFEVHARPMVEGGRVAGAVAVLHDVTRLRALEQMRRDFVANVSHELRTPLVSIKGFAETLRSGAIDDAAHRLEFLDTIEAEADRMSRLVDDLLELSAIESGRRQARPEDVDPLDLAREVAESIRPQAERRRVSVEVRRPPAPVLARADPGQLRQVLANLLVNAVKFNKEGGSVTVSCERSGRFVEVAVRDSGVGIPEEDLPRVFERFYRVDKARSRDPGLSPGSAASEGLQSAAELGGTGLGLAIVKHIVEAHGGTVSVESVEGEGSTFRFTLPAA